MCTCPVGTLDQTTKNRCIGNGIPIQVTATNSSLNVTAANVNTAFTQVRITIAQWRLDKTVVDVLTGFPKTLSARPFTYTQTKLEAGLRFQVKVEFGTINGYSADWVTVVGDSGGNVATACGCAGTDQTGGPVNVTATQVRAT